MLKKLALVLTLALALVTVPFAASAQSLDDQKNTVQQSGIQIQNLSGETANVSVRYVPAVGAPGNTVTQNVTVAPNASLTLLSFTEPLFAAPAGFRGSVVLESDQPILALTNLTNSNFSIAEGYPGFRQGATSVRVPLVVRNNIVPGGRASTAIAVQNTGTANTTVTVNYVSGGVFGNPGTIAPDTQALAPGQSVVFSQADKADLADPAATGDAVGRFIGSATITSSGGVPIAVTVQQEGNGQLGSYAASLLLAQLSLCHWLLLIIPATKTSQGFRSRMLVRLLPTSLSALATTKFRLLIHRTGHRWLLYVVTVV